MNKYRCHVCAFIYIPANNQGVSFESLPDSWVCPVCGATKEKFEKIHFYGEAETGGEAQEKHVPVIEQDGDKIKVKVGSIPHPMIEAHYITLVELYASDRQSIKITLQPNSEPVAIFEGIPYSSNLKALAHCNIHGIWESK